MKSDEFHFQSALRAEAGVWGARRSAVQTRREGAPGAMADHQVSDVGNPGEGIGENKHRIAPMNSVNEQQ